MSADSSAQWKAVFGAIVVTVTVLTMVGVIQMQFMPRT